MQLLQVRMDTGRNTGISQINLSFRYRKWQRTPWRLIHIMGTNLLEKAIRKDMTNVIIAYENLDVVTPEKMQTGNIKPGYKNSSTQMILDIKMS